MYNVREKKMEPQIAGWERELLVADRDRQLKLNIVLDRQRRLWKPIGR